MEYLVHGTIPGRGAIDSTPACAPGHLGTWAPSFLSTGLPPVGGQACTSPPRVHVSCRDGWAGARYRTTQYICRYHDLATVNLEEWGPVKPILVSSSGRKGQVMFALISEARGHGGHGHGMSSKPHVALTIQLSLHPGPQWSILPALAPAVWTAKGSAPQVLDKISMSCRPGHKPAQSGTQVNAVPQKPGYLGLAVRSTTAVVCSVQEGTITYGAPKRILGNQRRRHQQTQHNTTQHKHCCSPVSPS